MVYYYSSNVNKARWLNVLLLTGIRRIESNDEDVISIGAADREERE